MQPQESTIITYDTGTKLYCLVNRDSSLGMKKKNHLGLGLITLSPPIKLGVSFVRWMCNCYTMSFPFRSASIVGFCVAKQIWRILSCIKSRLFPKYISRLGDASGLGLFIANAILNIVQGCHPYISIIGRPKRQPPQPHTKRQRLLW